MMIQTVLTLLICECASPDIVTSENNSIETTRILFMKNLISADERALVLKRVVDDAASHNMLDICSSEC
jgi:hypothetical protein